jgi:hypothetical protein
MGVAYEIGSYTLACYPGATWLTAFGMTRMRPGDLTRSYWKKPHSLGKLAQTGLSEHQFPLHCTGLRLCLMSVIQIPKNFSSFDNNGPAFVRAYFASSRRALIVPLT